MRLVVDWDGTITVRDSLVQVIHEFGDPALLAELEPRVGVDLTLHEEIALEFEAIATPLDEVVRAGCSRTSRFVPGCGSSHGSSRSSSRRGSTS